VRRLPSRVLRRAASARRRDVVDSADRLALASLVILAAVVAVLAFTEPRWFPLASLTLPIYLGGVLLSVRGLVLYFALITVLVAGVGRARWLSAQPAPPGLYLLLAVTAVVVVAMASSRLRLGLAGSRGQSMLVDLRDRLRAQGEMPELPDGWSSEVVLRNAYGASFSGDFVVATRSLDSRLLEVALVDVSGKGVDAGTRALLLSGAFGGLLGALPSESFLPAANTYLLRQEWSEGFATAIHLVIELTSGDFQLMSAGHPPAVQFSAGSGRWRVIEEGLGPLLGVLEGAAFVAERGRLCPGDALLLYTDGLVEAPGLDLDVGIDRLVGQAERLVTRGFRGGGQRLVDSLGNSETDDRALLMLWRD
jgi:Stage II sporulation protein E (SpoIIE)